VIDRHAPGETASQMKMGGVAKARRLASAVLALALAMPAASRAAEPSVEALHAFFSAPVTIRATGQAEVGPVSGVHGSLAEAVRTKLMQVEIVPARIGGAAVDARMVMDGRAVLTPIDGGTYALALEGVMLMPPGAVQDVLVPPRFPAEMFTRGLEGSVELELTVDGAGRIVDMRTVSSTHAAFETAVRAAGKRWKFKASGDVARFSMPFVFRLAEKGSPPLQPKFECALAAGQAHVVGQNGCLPTIEVTGSRVRR
jgi:TonB family protein